MSNFECPHCHAILSLRDWFPSRYWTCPFCGEDGVSLLDREAPADGAGWTHRLCSTGSLEPSAGLVRPLPRGSELQVVSADAERLVLMLPSERLRDRALWLPIVSLVAAAVSISFALQAMQQGGHRLWLLGAGTMCLAVWAKGRDLPRMTQRRTLISIDPNRVVLQATTAFAREKSELAINLQTSCELCEQVISSGRSEPAVKIGNEDGLIVLGMKLSGGERAWLIREIRDRLPRVRTTVAEEEAIPASQDASDSRPVADDFPALPVSALPADSCIQVVTNGAEELTLQFGMGDICPPEYRSDRLALAGVCALLVILVGFGVICVVRDASQTALLSLLLLLSVPFVLKVVKWTLFLLLGRVTLQLTAEELVVRWSVGPFRRRTVVPLREIRAVLVGAAEYDGAPRCDSPLVDRIPNFRMPGGILIVTRTRTVVVNSMAQLGCAAQIGGLLKGKLESWGLSLPFDWIAVPSITVGEPG